VFIATPLLADLREREPEMRALHRRVMSRRQEPAVVAASPRSERAQRAGAGTAVLERTDAGADVEGATVDPAVTRAPRPTGPRNQPRRKNTRKRR
jgi:preprotein translocase subunit SecF